MQPRIQSFFHRISGAYLLVLMIGLNSQAVQAEVIEVQMLNNNPENPRSRNLFLPRVVHIQPGDVVKFIPVDFGHNAESINGLVPKDFPKFKSRLSESFEQAFEKEGIYAYKCTPHYAMGMVGIIVVGNAKPDIDQFKAKKMPRRAAKAFNKMFKELQVRDN